MRKGYFLALAVAAALLWPSAAPAQSLADIARAEEARRKAITKPVTKVYTNEDLTGAGRDTPSAPAPSPSAVTPAGQTPAAGGTTPDPAKDTPNQEPPKDEKYWRDRVTAARSALERSKVLLAALQSRVNALNTDSANQDDPAQRAVLLQDLQRAQAEMDRVKKEIDSQTKTISDIEEEARKASVPPGWLR